MNLPIIALSQLFHVGTMNISEKRKSNLEGCDGLSVSTEPEAWRHINKGFTCGDIYSLEKTNGKFIDYHSLSDDEWSQLTQWGVSNNFLKECTKHTVSYFDSEMDNEMCFEFETYQDACEEAESLGLGDEVEIKTIRTHTGTEAFASIIGGDNHENLSLVAVVYCIVTGLYDGVYWTDELDASRYSAPRGVITQSKLASWAITKMEQ